MQRLDRAGIEALLQTEQFKSWFAELSGLNHRLELLEAGIERAAEACAEASFRSGYWQEQAEEALLRSADLENTCHNLRIEIAQLENQAFDRLADFERVRDEVTELWVRITAIEHRCDDHPDEATRVRARARYQGELKKLRAQYAARNERKEALWHEEELIWMQVAEQTLMVPEIEVRSKRLAQRYSHLMARVEELQKREAAASEELADEREELAAVQVQLAELRAAAREWFSCVCHENFLYWPVGDDSKMALVLALVANQTDYNIEVTSGQIYQCETERGVKYLEPIRVAGAPDEEDERLSRFFEEVA